MDRIREAIAGAEKVLVGIGESYDGKGDAATKSYETILNLVMDKDHYIVSLCEDGVLNDIVDGLATEDEEAKGVKLVTPLDGNEDNWKKYNEWITRTLNRKLVVLELGVGLNYPNVVRWPFEKIVSINNKAVMFRVNKSLYQSTPEMGDKCTGIQANPLEYVV